MYSEQYKIIPCGNSVDFNAGWTGESIDTTNLHYVTYLISYGAVGGGGAAALTVKSGASDGVQTTPETFRARYSDAAQKAATGDTFTDWTSQTTLSVATATISTRFQIVEFDVTSITDGQPWITIALDGTADSGIVHCVAVCKTRYAGAEQPTCI